MKTLARELAFVAKNLDKGILATPFKVGETRYILTVGKIYSDSIFQHDITWTVLEEAYRLVEGKKEINDITIDLVDKIKTWDELDIENINTFDAVGVVAGIQGTEHGISIDTFYKLQSMCHKCGYFNIKYRYNKEGLLALIHSNSEQEDILIVTNLQIIQKSLLD